MVGSRDYFDKEIDGQFNIATAHRQPGSAFKPFAYATAFNKGYTPETVVFDVETEFSTACDHRREYPEGETNCYRPENYDHVYRGPVTFRNALAQSINIPAIKVLYLAGMKDTLRLAKDMGITSLINIGRYGLTLVLGGGEVSLLEMVNAYGAFANRGAGNPHTAILEVKDQSGNIIEKFESKTAQVLPEQTALRIADILSDNAARAPAFGESSYLYIPNRDVAVKTGTTNDYRDAWIIGFSPNIVVGAWAGNNNNTPMEKKVAGFIIAPLWNAFIQEALANIPDERFEKPITEDSLELPPVLRGRWEGGVSHPIDKISGKQATENTPKETLTDIVSGGVHSILYWISKDNPRGPRPENPASDPQFESWEYSVRKWVDDNNIREKNPDLPSGDDDVHRSENAPRVAFVSPDGDREYDPQEKLTVELEVQSVYPLSKVEYFIGDEFIGSSANTTFSFIPDDVNASDGDILRVVVTDKVYNKTEKTIRLRLD